MSVVRGQNCGGSGSGSVPVEEAEMGVVTYTGKGREEETGCEATEWESETSVRCMVSGGGHVCSANPQPLVSCRFCLDRSPSQLVKILSIHNIVMVYGSIYPFTTQMPPGAYPRLR